MDNSQVVVLGNGPVTERRLRQWLSKRWGKAFPSYVEAAHGSTPGLPDLMLQIPGLPGVLPVEIKPGWVMKGQPTRIRPATLRANQIFWHNKYFLAGGKACFLIGVPIYPIRHGRWPKDDFEVYVQTDCSYVTLARWRSGWPIATMTKVTGDASSLDYEAWTRCLGLEIPTAVGQPRPATEMATGALERAAR